MIRNLSVVTSFFLFASMAMAQLINPSDAAERLHALFEEDGQWTMEQFPEYATLLGDHRYNDRLTDLSFETIERCKAHEREILERIQKIQHSELSGQDLISYDLFLRDKRLKTIDTFRSSTLGGYKQASMESHLFRRGNLDTGEHPRGDSGASMEPHPFRRGNLFYCDWYRLVIHASMEPHLFRRGNLP